MLRKPNKKYYYLVKGKFVPVDGEPITIPRYESFDFFIAKTDERFHVYEGKTGQCAGHGLSHADAIAQFHYYMAENKWSVTRLRKEINGAVKRCGLSPRWKEKDGR